MTSGNASAAAQSGSPVCPEVAEQVRHRRRAQQLGRAERQAADGAQLLLELAGDAGVEGEVAGVVRARRQLVDEQLAVAREEELDAQHADDVERLRARRARSRRPRAPTASARRARARPRGRGCVGGACSRSRRSARTRRRAPRAATTETSRSKSTKASSTPSCPPSASQAVGGVVGARRSSSAPCRRSRSRRS